MLDPDISKQEFSGILDEAWDAFQALQPEDRKLFDAVSYLAGRAHTSSESRVHPQSGAKATTLLCLLAFAAGMCVDLLIMR